MAYRCCASCGHLRRQRGRVHYGQSAGACPKCRRGMYWTDWLDPRRLGRLLSRV